MRVDQPPFNDNRVRQAMKLIVDRPAMVESAISGFGVVANDLVGKGLPFYDASIPQTVQDLEKAKSLLKQAGQSKLSVTLYSSPILPGIPEAATLFASQAQQAGVTLNIKTIPANAYFNTSLQYLKFPFASSYWVLSSLAQWYTQAVATGAPYNETHWTDPTFEKLLNSALSAPSMAVAQQRWNEVQKAQHDQGGYLIWANVDNLDAVSSKVNGITPGQPYSIGLPTGLIDAWLS
jgi:peptide/nickel transport system substrate-binding protein